MTLPKWQAIAAIFGAISTLGVACERTVNHVLELDNHDVACGLVRVWGLDEELPERLR